MMKGLIGVLLGAALVLGIQYGIGPVKVLSDAFPAQFLSPAITEDGIRGARRPIVVIIESPEAIHAEAINRGAVEEDSPIEVMGFAAYNSKLTYCQIWVPPLTKETLWIWEHEVKHCNVGAFHK